jgi:hypothetical protein
LFELFEELKPHKLNLKYDVDKNEFKIKFETLNPNYDRYKFNGNGNFDGTEEKFFNEYLKKLIKLMDENNFTVNYLANGEKYFRELIMKKENEIINVLHSKLIKNKNGKNKILKTKYLKKIDISSVALEYAEYERIITEDEIVYKKLRNSSFGLNTNWTVLPAEDFCDTEAVEKIEEKLKKIFPESVVLFG